MICGNTQAEIDRDTQTNTQEQAQYEWEAKRWRLVLRLLLNNKNVHANGIVYTLKERLADQYQEFSDLVDQDNDFMAEYVSGGLDESVRKLIEREAETLASVIVG